VTTPSASHQRPGASQVPATLAAVCRILVIEDDEDTRETVQLALEPVGYVVTLARDGREGLELLRAMDPPCVILLDLMMPVMNGVEFLATVATNPSLASIPVVVFSAYRNVAGTFTAVDFLPKPFDLHNLLALAARFCGEDRL